MKNQIKPVYFYRYVTIILCLLFAHCARMSISSQCVKDEEGVCQTEQQGKTKLLVKKSVDILIVLDNSSKGQKLNPQITANLNQLIQCIEPLDWQVGVISGVEDKNSPMGHLISVERDKLKFNQEKPTPQKKPRQSYNRLLSREEKELAEIEAKSHKTGDFNSNLAHSPIHPKVISPHMADYKQAFANTVSLSSGCDKPPFCHKGKRKPLSALQAFMHNEEDKTQLLRESAHLAVVVVSSSDEAGGGFFAGQVVSAQEALSAVSLDYSSHKWTAFAVTDAGQTNDCINTAKDFARKGTNFLATIGDIAGMLTMDPLIMLGSAILKSQANKPQKSTQELSQFVSGGGGQTFDICKPFFGRAVAYSLLKSVDRESQFPETCKQFDKSQADSLKNSKH